MTDYDFSTINDKEFELLALDLLNAKFDLKLQAFKIGRDGGIDLRYSSPKNKNKVVVQAKHYVGSDYAQLKHTIKHKELKKVHKLKPERYIVVTSLPLSASQKDELKTILTPFVLSENDIIGREDLNTYLREFGEIEKTHFKLWFSSITALTTILNNAVESRTEYHLKKISSKIPFYVITQKLDDALKILTENKILLITGQPGIGKTTLADILLFDRARKDHQIYKVENIREAENVISNDPEQKQIFYFDDFLGANYYEIVNANKTETQLTSFVERVRTTPNKYLILTTRTVILNHAVEKYEKISHSKFASQGFELKLDDYTKYEKALILYNHLFFKSVNEELYDSILTDKFYKDIIAHKNYTPRIIEFITDRTKIDQLSPEQYKQFILNNLNNPKEIWRYSFNNQIEYLDRCLLLTLLSFNIDIPESILIKAYEKRLEFEKSEHNQIINSNQFNESIKIILNGFITSTFIKTPTPTREYSFINPSLGDFLLGYVANSYQERKSIISSVVYAEQLLRFRPSFNKIPLERDLQLLIRQKVADEEFLFIEASKNYFSENNYYAGLMDILFQYCSDTNIDSLLLKQIKNIDFSMNLRVIFWKLERVLLNLGDSPLTEVYIKEHFIEIIQGLMSVIFDNDEVKIIRKLFNKYGHNYDTYMSSSNGSKKLMDLADQVLEQTEENYISDRENHVTDMIDVETLYFEIEDVKDKLIEELFPNSSIDYAPELDIDELYWEDKIEENNINNARADAEAEMHRDHYAEMDYDEFEEDEAIDDLFDRSE